MQKRKFDELVSYFNKKVSEMEIETKYKMELLGMVTALGCAHEKEMSDLSETKRDSSDLISRQAAIDALMVAVDDVGVLDAEDIETVFALLPTAEPRTGKWLNVFVDGLGFNGLMFECSECGKRSAGRTNFCAYCGADMRGERNEP